MNLTLVRGQLKAWHPSVIGGVLGATVLPLAEPFIKHTVAFGAFLGLAAGVLFWVLWRPRPHTALNLRELRPSR
jgi:hypothetical protein